MKLKILPGEKPKPEPDKHAGEILMRTVNLAADALAVLREREQAAVEVEFLCGHELAALRHGIDVIRNCVVYVDDMLQKDAPADGDELHVLCAISEAYNAGMLIGHQQAVRDMRGIKPRKRPPRKPGKSDPPK